MDLYKDYCYKSTFAEDAEIELQWNENHVFTNPNNQYLGNEISIQSIKEKWSTIKANNPPILRPVRHLHDLSESQQQLPSSTSRAGS